MHLKVWHQQTPLQQSEGLGPHLLPGVAAQPRHPLHSEGGSPAALQHCSWLTCSTGHQARSHSSLVSRSQAVCTPMARLKRTCMRSSSCMVTWVYSCTSSSSLLSSASYLATQHNMVTLTIEECKNNKQIEECRTHPPCLGSLRAFRTEILLFLGVFLTALLICPFLWRLRFPPL